MKIIAIDPGCNGGIAFTDGETTSAIPMPPTLGDLVLKLRELSASGHWHCYLEQVVGFIPKAGAGAMFSFGQSFGQIQGCLAAMSFRVIEVRPAAWQKALSLGSKKDHPKTAWKNHLKANAQRLYPSCEVTLKTADALLILEYGRRQT